MNNRKTKGNAMPKLILSIILLLSVTCNLKAQFFSYSETSDKRPVISTGGNSVTADGDLALASLITDPTVIESLELSDLQKTELQKAIVDLGTANQEVGDKACVLMEAAKDVSETLAAQDSMLKEVKVNNRLLTLGVESILHDHQFSQLSGIAVNRFFSNASIDEVFKENSGILKALQMTDTETANVAKKVAEVRKKLKEDIKALKKEAAFEMIRSFPKDKQVLFQKQFGAEDN